MFQPKFCIILMPIQDKHPISSYKFIQYHIMNKSLLFFCIILCSMVQQGLPNEVWASDTLDSFRVQIQKPQPAYDYRSISNSKVAPVLKLASKLATIPDADTALLKKNIEAINFRNSQGTFCCGRLTITRPENVTDVITANGASVLTVSNYGLGRAVVLTSHLLFQEETLLNDKNWVFLLRNTIKYAAKTTYAKYEILALGINPTKSFKQLLARSGLVTNITFVWNLQDFTSLTKSKFYVVLIGSYSLEHLKINDYYKIAQYVSTGGGIITTFRPECLGCYNQPTWCQDISRKCIQNTFLHLMGIKFNDYGPIPVDSIQYNITDKMNLTNIVLKKYEKRNSSAPPEIGLPQDYYTLINGVYNLSYPGAAYSSFRYSEQAYFPIVKVNTNTIMLAGRFGLGKLFFEGHGTILERQSPDNSKFLSNIVNWLTGNKTELSVGFLFNNYYVWDSAFLKLPANITNQQIRSIEDIQGKDIIVVNYLPSWPANFTTAMIAAIKAYVQNGGSILFAAHGWVWGSYGDGAKNSSLIFEQSYVPYIIAKQFDVYLQKDVMGLQDPYSINRGARMADVQAFLKNDFLNVLKGQANFTTTDSKVNEYISKIQRAGNFTTICDILTYHSLVDALVLSRFNIETYYGQISSSDPLNIRVYQVMNALSYAAPPSECRALPPSLNKFPGCATKIIPNKTLSIYKNTTQRVYTGLYINPGEAIRITHNSSFLEVIDLTLWINHGDWLYGSNNGNLNRYPDIVRSFPIKSRNFTVASPHGGILWFRVDKQSNTTTPVNITIFGAYEAPYFNENQHSVAQFSVIRLADAPIFVFETKKFVIIGPTFGLAGSIIINIPKLCAFWNKVIQTYKQYRNISISPFLKDATYSDVNIGAGYMHSGNPFMTFQDVTLQFLGWKNSIYIRGNWGAYHELGHNHQDWKWTLPGMGQVTCNIYSLYLMQLMNGIPILDHPWFMNDYPYLLEKLQSLLLLPQNQRLAIFNADVQFSLYFYAILMGELGPTFFSTVQKRYNLLTDNLSTDLAKYEMFAQQLSLAANLNMWDYVYNWGMPVTATSKAKVANLTRYVCKRHPNLTP